MFKTGAKLKNHSNYPQLSTTYPQLGVIGCGQFQHFYMELVLNHPNLIVV